MTTTPQAHRPILETARERLGALVAEHALNDAEVAVRVKALTPEEAIGLPERRDFPILIGKEKMIEATVLGARGQAFTDAPAQMSGTVADVLALPLASRHNRALLVATLNAVLRHLGLVTGTVHCRDEEPEACAEEMAALLRERFGAVRVGLVGLNPAIAQRLAEAFGPGNLHITDLNPDNIGKERFGATVWDGATRTRRLVEASDLVLATGTTLTGGTFDDLHHLTEQLDRKLILYGVTAAGVAHLTGLERLCLRGRDG